jgi:hypothetical protein
MAKLPAGKKLTQSTATMYAAGSDSRAVLKCRAAAVKKYH